MSTDASTETLTRLTISVPRSFRDALKIRAVECGKTLREYVTEALTERLEENFDDEEEDEEEDTAEEDEALGMMAEEAEEKGEFLSIAESRALIDRIQHA